MDFAIVNLSAACEEGILTRILIVVCDDSDVGLNSKEFVEALGFVEFVDNYHLLSILVHAMAGNDVQDQVICVWVFLKSSRDLPKSCSECFTVFVFQYVNIFWVLVEAVQFHSLLELRNVIDTCWQITHELSNFAFLIDSFNSIEDGVADVDY